MKFKDFKLAPKKESEQILDEVRMDPTALTKFMNSPAAEGMMAGFEAELVFEGMGVQDSNIQGEPDYEMDERPVSIPDVLRFFSNDDFNLGLARTGRQRLEYEMREEYRVWVDKQIDESFAESELELVTELMRQESWDEEIEVADKLRNKYSEEDVERILRRGDSVDRETYDEAYDAANAEFEEKVEDEIRSQGVYWSQARDEFTDEFDLDEDYWVQQTYDSMMEVANAYDLEWPFIAVGDEQGEYVEASARDLADDFRRTFREETVKVSSGYHTATRDGNNWVFEADSSIIVDDMRDLPIEIISPPKPLKEVVEYWLPEFFAWAKDNNAYSNKSTGFHMGVSLSSQTTANLDTVKLALFLGDEYVLKQFKRQNSTYAESFLKRIKTTIKNIRSNHSPANAARDTAMLIRAFEDLRKGITDASHFMIHQSSAGGQGFGKYFSINPKANYVEFRSAGGKDYFDDIDKLKNTLMRYAQAMYIAANPEAERNEYFKKLYKVLSPTILKYWNPKDTDPESTAKGFTKYHQTKFASSDVRTKGSRVSVDPTEMDDIIGLFCKYMVGLINSNTLKKEWADKVLASVKPKEQQDTSDFKKHDWVISDINQEQVMFLPDMIGWEALRAAFNKYGNGSLRDFLKYGYEINKAEGSEISDLATQRQLLAQKISSSKKTDEPKSSTKLKRYMVGFKRYAGTNHDTRYLEVDAANEHDAWQAAIKKPYPADMFANMTFDDLDIRQIR